MLRKALTLGMVFILALSLLAVSMITCFAYDAEAHDLFYCVNPCTCEVRIVEEPICGWNCSDHWHTH